MMQNIVCPARGRAYSWLGQSDRLGKDYEPTVQTRKTLIKAAMIRLPLRRASSSAPRAAPALAAMAPRGVRAKVRGLRSCISFFYISFDG